MNARSFFEYSYAVIAAAGIFAHKAQFKGYMLSSRFCSMNCCVIKVRHAKHCLATIMLQKSNLKEE